VTGVVLVVAKAPVPGLAKTRLCPPATPRQAAAIAAAALLDTLAAVRATRSVTPVLAYAGRFAEAERAAEIRAALAGWEVIPQRGNGLGERLARAHLDTAATLPGRPVLVIATDTPQVTPRLLAAALRRLATADAVLGPATDGGWWALGLHDPRHATVLRDVPMSTPRTGELTGRALAARGLRVAGLPSLSDVDTWGTAVAVAASLPGSRFATAVGTVAASESVRFVRQP
jgi:rSAM/selenodomain-associated transferase 1